MSAIVPLDKVTTLTIHSFTLDRIEVDLFNSARIRVNLMDKDNNRIDCTFVTLTGEDYTNWGNSDDYIINYVANKLGFIVQSVVHETPVPAEDPVPAPAEDPVPAPVEVPVPAPVEDPAPALAETEPTV
jgi:hypothetical protein